jgi:predicted nuclease of predicted toxin-antitoxin system
MKFFLDENFPKKAIELLEKRNFEIIDIRGTKKEGLDDNKIFDLAKKSKSVFLTTDKDFYHTIHFTSQPHFGIVVIAISQPNAIKIL